MIDRKELYIGSADLTPQAVQRNAAGVALGQARSVLQLLTENDAGRERQLQLFEERVRGISDLGELDKVLSVYFGDNFLGTVQSSVRARCEVGINCQSPVRTALLEWTDGVVVPDFYKEFVSKKIGRGSRKDSIDL